MALEVKHKFQSQQPNGTDESVIRPVNWNDDHNLVMAGPALLGKSDLGNGPVTEISLSTDFEFDGDVLKLAQPTSPGGSSYTDEQAQDAVAAAIAAGTHDGIQVTYNDAANSFSLVNTDTGTVARAAHEAASDPHGVYLTQVRGDARYPVLVGGLVQAINLPSFVDDVLEFANLAAFPVTGESGKIYVTVNTNKSYRWSGSAYTEIVASPGSTDAVTEGSSNLYFTSARVRAVVLTGLSVATVTVIDAADTMLSALGKLQAQITKFVDQVNVFTKAQRSQIVALTHVSNVYTPDFSAGNFFSFTPAANFTLANPSNLPAAGITQSGSFFIMQDATGSRVATFGNAYAWTGGTAGVLSTTPNARDRIDYVIGPTGLVHLSIGKDVKVPA